MDCQRERRRFQGGESCVSSVCTVAPAMGQYQGSQLTDVVIARPASTFRMRGQREKVTHVCIAALLTRRLTD